MMHQNVFISLHGLAYLRHLFGWVKRHHLKTCQMVVSKLANWLVKNYPDAVLTALKPDSKNWKAGCEFMVEMDGHKYYRFRDSGDVPLVRYKEIQAVLIQLDNRLTSDELLNILSIARESVVAAIEGQSRKDRGKGLQQCLWAIQEAESRHKELGLHTDLIVEAVVEQMDLKHSSSIRAS